MKNWIAITGDFKENGSDIIFQGGILPNVNDSENNDNIPGKAGIILFKDIMANGEICLDVEFASLNKFDEAEILFDFQDESHFMCAGVTNSPYKYEFKNFNGQWNWIRFTGNIMELPSTKYNLRVRINGSVIELYVNSIKVLNAISTTPINKTNIGVWVRSKSSITLSNYRASYQKNSAFIVSQFGGDYDVLYNDVIKPVCEKHNYQSIRADEINASSMILKDIISLIENATIVIADISPDNPNVFYELGYAHALKKQTVLLCEKGCRNKLPFDISSFRTIFYDNTIGGKKLVENNLERFLKELSCN